MKRVAVGIGVAIVLFAVGLSLARENGAADRHPKGAPTYTSTTYTIWAIDPPSPLDGSDLPMSTAPPDGN